MIASLTASRSALAALAAAGLGLLAPAAVAGEYNTGYFGDVAIKGYDTVAYFTDGRAIPGRPEFSHRWLGAEWLFSSPEHRSRFVADPVSYAPQFGGMCADGISYGTMTVNINPEAFAIIDGKLYLNYDHGGTKELTEIPGQVERAEAQWPAVRQQFVGN